MHKVKKHILIVSLAIAIFHMPIPGRCQMTDTGCTSEYQFNGTKLNLTEKQWKERLTPEEFEVLRKGKTEPAFHNAYYNNERAGIYECAGCFLPLYSSKTKYEAGTGWPSFWAPICPQNVEVHKSFNPFSSKREVTCSRCDGHLGDVFNDGPPPTGKRYCMNSAALKFIPQ